MSFTLKPHLLKQGPNGVMQLVRSQPYLRLKAGEDPPIFVQNGQFYSEGGQAYKKDDLPDWLDDELAKVKPGARQEVGLKA